MKKIRITTANTDINFYKKTTHSAVTPYGNIIRKNGKYKPLKNCKQCGGKDGSHWTICPVIKKLVDKTFKK